MMTHLRIVPFLVLVFSFLVSSNAMAGFKNVQISGGFSFPNLEHANRSPFNNSQVYGQTNGNNHSHFIAETFWQFGDHKRGLELGLGLVEMGANLKTGTATNTRQYYEKTPYYVVVVNHKWLILDYLNLGAGFYVGSPAGKTIREGQNNGVNFYSETNTGDNYKTLDYGLTTDIEGTLNFDEHWYGVSQFKFHYSLVNLNLVGTGTITQYTALLSFGLGYKF